MIPPNHPNIRRLLRRHRDGMTVKEIAEHLNRAFDSIYNALKAMPDSYVDRWTEAQHQAPTEAIWCVVVPPPHCPKPNARLTKLRRLVK